MLTRQKSLTRRVILATALVAASLILGSTLFNLLVRLLGINGPPFTPSIHLSSPEIKSSDNNLDPRFDIDGTPFCERSITFVLSDCCGFPFQMISLINAMVYAQDTGRVLFIDDTNWNYGRWNNFFEPFATPACVRPYDRNVFAKYPNRPLSLSELKRMDIKFQRAPHQIMTRWSWHLLDEHIFNTYNNEFVPGILQYEDIFRAQERVLKKIWKLNHEERKLTHDQSYEIGIPHGHGGLPPQNLYIAFQIHHKDSLDNYLTAAEQYMSQKSGSKQDAIVFITSRKDITEVCQNLTLKKPDWQFITSFQDEPMYRFNPAQKSRLLDYNLKDRINFGMALVADITLMKEAAHLVCAFVAPLCRFLVMLKGFDTLDSTASIEGEWFPTLFPPDEQGKPTNPHRVFWNNLKKISSDHGNKAISKKFDALK